MLSTMSNLASNDATHENLFWKSYLKAVPGRPSRHKEDKISNQHSSVAQFQDFEKKVSDAWDIGENDFYYFSDEMLNDGNYSNSREKSDHMNKDALLPFKSTTSSISPYHGKNNLPVVQDVKPHTPNSSNGRLAKFQTILQTSSIDIDELKRLSWSGVPPDVRPTVWRLLAGYIPVRCESQASVLERKRLEYWKLIEKYYNPNEWDNNQRVTFRQIHIDIPRMSQLTDLFQQKTVQEMFERILFIWAIKHPASGYVQGINDLVTPFFVVFLKEIVTNKELGLVNIDSIQKETLNAIEADSFWCLSKFLDGVQDNYTFAQVGIQRKINKIKELINRIDPSLHKHLQDNDIEYINFSYRWVNNLLTRELSLECIIRLWDTYLAEVDSFASFHDYICVAFLEYWRKLLLKEKDFQGLMLTLQKLPTRNWTETEIDILVAEAYKLKYFFADCPKHLINVDTN